MNTPILDEMDIMFRSFSQTSFRNRYPSVIIINGDLHQKLIAEHLSITVSPIRITEPCDLKFAGTKIIRSNDIPYIEMY